MSRKIPLRKCVVTQERLPKGELVRVVKNKEGELSVDITGKANGRGAYLKLDKTVIERAMKRKVLSRALEIEVPDSIYEELLNLAKSA